jgi:ATP-dependent DNA helicase RecQ
MEDDTFKYILQDKQFHLQIKAEQKEIIQNVLERKDSMAVLPTGFGKSMCYVLPFWTRYYIVDHIFVLMVICNSLLLLKSLPINVINCIKLYVNCSALTGAYD